MGGVVYQELGRPYTTPFVGLFLFSPDYIKLLKNLSYYLSLDLTFTDHSKYGRFSYPVGLLDDVEIHFLHYATKEEAYQKWTRRKARINYDNLFVKMNDSDQCTNELMTEFDKLPFQHKVFFSAQKVEGMESLIWLKELSKASCIKNGKDIKVYRKYFDVVRWLNQGRNVRLKE